MSRLFFLSLLLLIARAASAETPDPYDADRKMIRNGVQAVLMCNGLFTSHRTLEQVFEQELAYLFRFGGAVGTAIMSSMTNERALAWGEVRRARAFTRHFVQASAAW